MPLLVPPLPMLLAAAAVPEGRVSEAAPVAGGTILLLLLKPLTPVAEIPDAPAAPAAAPPNAAVVAMILCAVRNTQCNVFRFRPGDPLLLYG